MGAAPRESGPRPGRRPRASSKLFTPACAGVGVGAIGGPVCLWSAGTHLSAGPGRRANASHTAPECAPLRRRLRLPCLFVRGERGPRTSRSRLRPAGAAAAAPSRRPRGRVVAHEGRLRRRAVRELRLGMQPGAHRGRLLVRLHHGGPARIPRPPRPPLGPRAGCPGPADPPAESEGRRRRRRRAADCRLAATAQGCASGFGEPARKMVLQWRSESHATAAFKVKLVIYRSDVVRHSVWTNTRFWLDLETNIFVPTRVLRYYLAHWVFKERAVCKSPMRSALGKVFLLRNLH